MKRIQLTDAQLDAALGLPVKSRLTCGLCHAGPFATMAQAIDHAVNVCLRLPQALGLQNPARASTFRDPPQETEPTFEMRLRCVHLGDPPGNFCIECKTVRDWALPKPQDSETMCSCHPS